MALNEKERMERLEERRLKKWNEQHKIIDGVDHKKCNKCELYYPSSVEYFYKNDKNGIDGFYPYCIECTKIKSKKFLRENEDKRKKYKIKYNQTTKAKEDTRERVRRWRESGRQKEYQKENKEKIKQYNNKYSNHAHDITDDEWFDCLEFFNWSCAYCGYDYDDHCIIEGQQLHREHVYHDGSIYIENCVPACKSCNSQKHDTSFEKWYNESNPLFSKKRFNRIVKWVTKFSL